MLLFVLDGFKHFGWAEKNVPNFRLIYMVTTNYRKLKFSGCNAITYFYPCAISIPTIPALRSRVIILLRKHYRLPFFRASSIFNESDRIILRWIGKSRTMLTCSLPVWTNYFTFATRRRLLAQAAELEKPKTAEFVIRSTIPIPFIEKQTMKIDPMNV